MTTTTSRTLPLTAAAEALNDEVLQVVAARGVTRQYPANAVLVNEDDAGDSLYVILRGRVKAYGVGEDGREVVYGTQGPGEYFGEMTLDGGPRSASIITLEPTTCSVVPGPALRELLATHPPFALHLVTKLIRLARASTEQVKSLALEDVYGRVARLLRRLAREEDGVLVVPDKLTQQDIADRVGASREMISRIFKQLTDGGYTGVRAGRITVLKKLPSRW